MALEESEPVVAGPFDAADPVVPPAIVDAGALVLLSVAPFTILPLLFSSASDAVVPDVVLAFCAFCAVVEEEVVLAFRVVTAALTFGAGTEIHRTAITNNNSFESANRSILFTNGRVDVVKL